MGHWDPLGLGTVPHRRQVLQIHRPWHFLWEYHGISPYITYKWISLEDFHGVFNDVDHGQLRLPWIHWKLPWAAELLPFYRTLAADLRPGWPFGNQLSTPPHGRVNSADTKFQWVSAPEIRLTRLRGQWDGNPNRRRQNAWSLRREATIETHNVVIP